MGSHCLKVTRFGFASASIVTSCAWLEPLVNGHRTTSIPSLAIVFAASIRGLLASNAMTFPGRLRRKVRAVSVGKVLGAASLFLKAESKWCDFHLRRELQRGPPGMPAAGPPRPGGSSFARFNLLIVRQPTPTQDSYADVSREILPKNAGSPRSLGCLLRRLAVPTTRALCILLSPTMLLRYRFP